MFPSLGACYAPLQLEAVHRVRKRTSQTTDAPIRATLESLPDTRGVSGNVKSPCQKLKQGNSTAAQAADAFRIAPLSGAQTLLTMLELCASVHPGKTCFREMPIPATSTSWAAWVNVRSGKAGLLYLTDVKHLEPEGSEVPTRSAKGHSEERNTSKN